MEKQVERKDGIYFPFVCLSLVSVCVCVCVCLFTLQVTDMGIVLEVVEALEGITITADDIRVSSKNNSTRCSTIYVVLLE